MNVRALLAAATASFLFSTLDASSQTREDQAIGIDADDIAGVVSSRDGPEAGVWVIAESKDMGTRFAKIVVTDDQGRYVIPDLPKAKYRLWVRNIIHPSIGSRCSKFLAVKNSPAQAPPAMACRKISRRRSSGSISSKRTAAARAISSAMSRRAQSPRRSGISIHPLTPGADACNRDRREPP